MRVSDLIVKKRNGENLTETEIRYFIQNYVSGDIPDYQMSAFCMAVYFQGMDTKETAILTQAMVDSGETVDLTSISGLKVDKHSTGGVADTTTLVLAPLVAAAGVPVAKMTGRGLGHTGGTVDKLESIPGLKTDLTRETFLSQIKKINLALASQSGKLVPADKKMYALRDVTGTVSSIPLIASSIMSKKIAAGAEAIVLDVKTGSGAFMKELDNAYALAEAMVGIGKEVGRETIAIISDMNDPLGMDIGNASEVSEAIEVLQGKKKGALRDLCLILGSYMVVLAKRERSISAAYKLLEETLESGSALKKLAQLIEIQRGTPEVIYDTALLPQANYKKEIHCEKDGYIHIKDNQALGLAAMVLGAGRETKESIIDPAVGIKMHVRTGDKVKKGQPLLTLFYNDSLKLPEAYKSLSQAIEIRAALVSPRKLVYGVVTANGREELPEIFRSN